MSNLGLIADGVAARLRNLSNKLQQDIGQVRKCDDDDGDDGDEIGDNGNDADNIIDGRVREDSQKSLKSETDLKFFFR